MEMHAKGICLRHISNAIKIGIFEVRLLRPLQAKKYRKKVVLYENQRGFLLTRRLKAQLSLLFLLDQLGGSMSGPSLYEPVRSADSARELLGRAAQ